MNFLELVQQVASDSGTARNITTVAGATGRVGKIVGWTNRAWRAIQNAHGSWRWMEGEFEGDTVASQGAYSGSDFGATRFGTWLCTKTPEEARFFSYDPDADHEGRLRFLDWTTFQTTQRGTAEGRPAFFTITPDDRIRLSPIPDKVYKIRGPYRKDVQNLSVDGDEPEMPARFHDLIVDAALILLGASDESPQMAVWRIRSMEGFSALERDQLPPVEICGPLA